MREWYDGHSSSARLFEERIRGHLDRTLKRAGVGDFKVETRTKSVDSLRQQGRPSSRVTVSSSTQTRVRRSRTSSEPESKFR